MRHFDPDDLPDRDPTPPEDSLAEEVEDYLRHKTPGDRNPPAEDDDEYADAGHPVDCDCDRCNGSEYNPLDQPEPIGGWEGNRP